MRLTCPACGARYAVDDDAIPQSGRMVQCSACRAEWRATPPAIRATASPTEPVAEALTAPLTAPSALRQAAPPPTATPLTAVAAPIPTPIPTQQPAALAASLQSDEAPPRRGGFFTGLIVVAVLAGAAVTLYAKQAAIATAAPALAEPLSAYVSAVDRGRALLAETVARLRQGG